MFYAGCEWAQFFAAEHFVSRNSKFVVHLIPRQDTCYGTSVCSSKELMVDSTSSN